MTDRTIRIDEAVSIGETVTAGVASILPGRARRPAAGPRVVALRSRELTDITAPAHRAVRDPR